MAGTGGEDVVRLHVPALLDGFEAHLLGGEEELGLLFRVDGEGGDAFVEIHLVADYRHGDPPSVAGRWSAARMGGGL